jgi:hypothetical protein
VVEVVKGHDYNSLEQFLMLRFLGFPRICGFRNVGFSL